MRTEPSYRAYLLRLWLANPEGTSAGWRASLEDPHTGERLGFASLEQLFAYLLALTEGRDNTERWEKGNSEPP